MPSHPLEAPDRGYYALLGVGASAGDDEIKRAYRQLATTLHPDKVADAARRDEASHLFTRIQEAYEVSVWVPRCPGVLVVVCVWCVCDDVGCGWAVSRGGDVNRWRVLDVWRLRV